MKSNELRLGNFIKQGKIDLLEVRENDIFCRCNGTSVLNPEPLKITPEFLIKNGFEFDKLNSGENLEQDSYEFKPTRLIISVNLDYNTKKYFIRVNYEYEMGIQFEYVHELQNLLYALYRIELVCA